MRREQISALKRTAKTALPAGALDLRLGTLAGSVQLALSEPAEFGRRRGRANAEIVATRLVAVAVVRADDALAQALSRRINV